MDFGSKIAPIRDSGHANFSASGGARNAVAYANPLTPGGMSPKGVNIPTLAWVAIFAVAIYLVWKHGGIKRYLP